MKTLHILNPLRNFCLALLALALGAKAFAAPSILPNATPGISLNIALGG